MTNHPLDYDTCEEIALSYLESEDDLNTMRAAADWQLEQVFKWIRDNIQENRYSGSLGIDVDYIIEDLQKAMRPTQEDTP